jgi:hypothetical protein
MTLLDLGKEGKHSVILAKAIIHFKPYPLTPSPNGAMSKPDFFCLEMGYCFLKRGFTPLRHPIWIKGI